MSDLISVIVPVGHVDPLLRVQLDALAAQDIDRPFEIVLACNFADPGSLTSDPAIHALDDARVRVVTAAGRRSASHARNVGAANAHGGILAFCDADDRVHPEWLRLLVDGLGRFDAVSGRLIDYGLTEKQARVRPPSAATELPTFLGVPYLFSGSMAISRDVFAAIGGFDETLIRCEDIGISWRLIGAGHRIGFVPEAKTDYRHRPGTWPMLKQHVLYGRGMSQVLIRQGIPSQVGATKPSGMKLLKPNGQKGGRRSLLGVMRRGALAVGRVVGIVEERLPRRSG